jgi:hypothetical protein
MVSALMVANNWEIGPIIDGKNYSIGMPLRPTQTADGWSFDFPLSPGSVHYVTYRFGSLAGKTHIKMKYRIEMDSGVQLRPVCCAQLPSVGPTLYFQRKGDDWGTENYRWWDTPDATYPMKAGEFEIDIPLDTRWTSVQPGVTAANSPQDFAAAIQNAERVGFTFGGGDGYGHGVYADGFARFVLLSFTVE